MRIRYVVPIVAMLCSGCVERKEKLVIAPEGSVLWQVEYRSDSLNDLLNDDAVPTPGGGWIVAHEEERDDDGNVTHILKAETVFSAKKHQLAEGYGSAADIEDEVCLTFPTSVTFEKRRDAVYCHFSRTYQPRAWAKIEQLRQDVVERPLDAIGGEPKDWTEAQRIAITQALARFEVEKTILFARAAWLEALATKPQDGYLVIRDDLHAFLTTLDYPSLAMMLVPPEDDDEDKELQKSVELQTTQLKAAIIARVHDAAQELAGLDGGEAAALLAACDKHRRTFEVTEDLNDDGFEIEVQMPGPIVASNAEGISGHTATWKFKGEQLHDNAIELLVTSRVEE